MECKLFMINRNLTELPFGYDFINDHIVFYDDLKSALIERGVDIDESSRCKYYLRHDSKGILRRIIVEVNMYRKDLSGLDFTNTMFIRCHMMESNLSRCVLDNCTFSCTQLTSANISNASAQHANFSDASDNSDRFGDIYMCNINFRESDLRYCDFSSQYLGRSIFTCANLENANFTYAHLNRCWFSSANVENVILRDTLFYNTRINNTLFEHFCRYPQPHKYTVNIIPHMNKPYEPQYTIKPKPTDNRVGINDKMVFYSIIIIIATLILYSISH